MLTSDSAKHSNAYARSVSDKEKHFMTLTQGKNVCKETGIYFVILNDDLRNLFYSV